VLINLLQAFAVQNAIVVYRDIDEFIQTLFCDEYVLGVALDSRLGSVSILLLPLAQTLLDCRYHEGKSRRFRCGT